jgi:AraC-like DNA-binding protein
MTKPNCSYEPHLELQEITLPPGGESAPGAATAWSVIQAASGTGYWVHPQSSQEIEAGMVLLLPPQSPGTIRASRLGDLSLRFFEVEPERLSGAMALREQDFLRTLATRTVLSCRIQTPSSPAAARMNTLWAGRDRRGLRQRLQLLQLFADLVGDELDLAGEGKRAAADARERLHEFLNRTPAADLLQIGFNDLVQLVGCTPRHLTRIFRDVVGMSYREKLAQLRLERARELLATTEAKVVNVALESGYQSLSLFNLMFARRFGMSPGKWRTRHHLDRLVKIRGWRKEANPVMRKAPATRSVTQL